MPPRSMLGSFKGKFQKKEKSSLFASQPSSPSLPPQININEAPPAYSATPEPTNHGSAYRSTANNSTTSHQHRSLMPSPSSRQPSPAPTLESITSDNDKYGFLSTFDTIFLVDDSGSMAGRNWRETSAAIKAITPICTSHDVDGIDMYFLNHKSLASSLPPYPSSAASHHTSTTRPPTSAQPPGGYYNITRADTVHEIFQAVRPQRTTPLGARLHSILKPYIASLSAAHQVEDVKPVNIIVITDGRPTDDPESVIIQHARKLDALDAPPYQVGIQFFQVGRDLAAREFLRELDDDLAEQGVRDMVDTTTWEEDEQTGSSSAASGQPLTADSILKVVLGAVVRRLDRKATINTGRSRT